MTHQLTIRYDDELAQDIEALAEQDGISRNQAVLRLLRKGAGRDQPRDEGVIGHSLDWFVGTWTKEEVREFEEAVADFEKIDEELWQ
jgi:hypothetical protein